MTQTAARSWDWQRILSGTAPDAFYLELILRTIFIYALLLFSLRLLGKRMASQLNQNELVALVALAAAVGVPLHAAERGLIPAVLIAGIVVLTGRIIAAQAVRNSSFERQSQGDINVLVKDGVLQIRQLTKVNLSRERVLAQLRYKRIKSLGQVKRLYLEPAGTFSLVRSEFRNTGLSIIPSYDSALQGRQHKQEDLMVCGYCGFIYHQDIPASCSNCGHHKPEAAVVQDP